MNNKYIFILIIVILLFFYLINTNYQNKNVIQTFKNTNIPKIIIQTWKNTNIPNQYIDLVESVKKYNPTYKYILFTDDNILNFLKENYPNYYETTNNINQRFILLIIKLKNKNF